MQKIKQGMANKILQKYRPIVQAKKYNQVFEGAKFCKESFELF